MNVKKMTLTLSTLLILVQPSYATDPATAAAVACSALALGTMFTGGSQKEIQKLRNQIAELERNINGQEQAVGLGRPAVLGLRDAVKDLQEMVKHDNHALYQIQDEFYGTAAHQGNPAIPGFKKITSDRLTAIDQEMITIKVQIAALQAVKGDVVADDAGPLADLREQLARELPQFRRDIDGLNKRFDEEARALKEMHQGFETRLVALEEFKAQQEQDLAALLVDDKK